MPARLKRKNADVEEPRTAKQPRTTRTQKSISTFGSVGKANVDKKQAKKSVQEKEPAPVQPVGKADKKRKRVKDTDDEDVIVVSSRPIAQSAKQTKVPSTPRNKRVKNLAPPSPTETPSRSTAALFDKLNLDAKSQAIPCPLSGQQSSYSTPPDTPHDERNGLDLELPAELEELQELHAAFLSSLAFYYSHNGSASPADLNTLLPQVSQKYRKRNVKLSDLQRILGIVGESNRPFNIQDYGRAGICLTNAKPLVSSLGRPANNIDPITLGEDFDEALDRAWRKWRAIAAKENRTASAFISHLPLLEITKNESAIRAAPLFARGQQRLADLKGSSIAKEDNSKVSLPGASLPKSLQATQNRGTALLDRILAKQNLASTLPAGPTKDQLERKAALHRVEDVTRVLSLLTGTKERFSLSMPAIVQHLQQSLRNPISKDEVQRCLGLMSSEIAPGFVKVIQSGDIKGVVITKSGNVGLEELRARVEKACA